MKQYTSLYFVGAGGIGMSALVRYFLAKGYKVAGYDRTQSPLTTELKAEGLEIVYEESVESIPDYCRNPETTLVVYTPAIPRKPCRIGLFQGAWFPSGKACRVVGADYAIEQRPVLCRHSWQDHDIEHGCSYLS